MLQYIQINSNNSNKSNKCKIICIITLLTCKCIHCIIYVVHCVKVPFISYIMTCKIIYKISFEMSHMFRNGTFMKIKLRIGCPTCNHCKSQIGCRTTFRLVCEMGLPDPGLLRLNCFAPNNLLSFLLLHI